MMRSLIALLLMLPSAASAQIAVRGTNVGTNVGAITDQHGRYHIILPKHARGTELTLLVVLCPSQLPREVCRNIRFVVWLA